VPTTKWDIQLEGRAWSGEEARARWELTPEKFEMYEGKLFWSDEQRIDLLGLLLENIGALEVVRLGDPGVWREAVRRLEQA
jgi:hypothetical protein